MSASENQSPSNCSRWVVEVVLDMPVCFEKLKPKKDFQLSLPLGGEDPDGFVQCRPINLDQIGKPSWWTEGEPLKYMARGLVVVSDAFSAMLRGTELFEHVADRLTLHLGVPIRVLEIGFVYNEDQLRDCVSGEISEYDCTTGGAFTFQTNDPKNLQSPQFLHPPKDALEGMRWFRRAMCGERRIEQFLFYFISLESIAAKIPGIERQPKRDKSGNKTTELESCESAGFRRVIDLHPELPSNTRQTLASIRSRIAHGNSDAKTLWLASKNLPLMQRLAADAIALVCGEEPEKTEIMQPPPFESIAPMGAAIFSEEENPTTKWGGFLSDSFEKVVREHGRDRSDSD